MATVNSLSNSNEPKLYRYEEMFSFGPNGAEAFRQRLVELDRDTVCSTIHSENEVLMNRQGLTLAGFSHTKSSLLQTCLWTASGLWDMMTDVAGFGRKAGQERSDFSFDEAIQIYNTVVKRRFKSRLYGKKIIRRGNLIVGLRPQRSYRMPSLLLFDSVREHIDRYAASLVFQGARICGTTTSFRYRRKTPYVTVKAPSNWDDNWFDGFCYRNTDSGDKSTNSCLGMLCRERDFGCALSDPANKLVGRFACDGDPKRLNQLIEPIGTRHEAHPKLMSAEEAKAAIERMRNTSLGLGTGNEKADIDRKSDIIDLIDRYVQAHKASAKALASCLRYGSYDDVREEGEAPAMHSLQKVFATRTVYDLCNAVCREAKALSPMPQEKCERAAYRMFTNRIKL